MNIADARAFARAFFAVAENQRLPRANGPGAAALWTQWFEDRMHAIAKEHNVHCQNHGSKRNEDRGGEWMKVDHVFVNQTNTYADFPLVAVEHENGGFSKPTLAGEMPRGWEPGACIEWALWKALAMRAKLSVLVAYPSESQEDNARAFFARVLNGYQSHYGESPNVLFLLGWWSDSVQQRERASDLYKAYTFDKSNYALDEISA